MKQCKACPWKVSTVPDKDIPGGYSCDLHVNLENTIAEPGSIKMKSELRMMACHESTRGDDRVCVGWLDNQLGPGNNIPLRIAAMKGKFGRYQLDGPQHECFEDTLPKED